MVKETLWAYFLAKFQCILIEPIDLLVMDLSMEAHPAGITNWYVHIIFTQSTSQGVGSAFALGTSRLSFHFFGRP